MVSHGGVTEPSIASAFVFFEEAPFGVLLADDALRVCELNDVARRLFAAIPDAIGRGLQEVAPLLAHGESVETIVRLFERTLETGEPHSSPASDDAANRLTPPKGLHWEINRVSLSRGRRGVVCYLRENANAIPRHSQPQSPHATNSTKPPKPETPAASRVKDEFLATVSHELRSPLQGILGWLTLLQGGRLDASQTTRALQSVERSVRLQAQLVNDIMDIARIEARRIEIERMPLDIAKLLRTTADEFMPQARARRIELDVGVKSCGFVLGDRERLHQVFSNLLSNSLKFTPAGGAISVSCSREGNDIVATVVDTGHGIDTEFMPFLFRRFSQADTSMTRRHGGLGLGLAIVRHLVELHGGSVDATSPGRDCGTTLVVRLPAANIAESAQAVEADGAISRLDDTDILLVDDDEDSLEAMTHALASLGARVRAATSVDDGWRAFEERAPDLVVTDLSMPEEDGYALLRRILGHRHPPPVVALTGLTRREDKERVIEAGFAAFVAKPVDLRQLAGSLKVVLDRSALGM